MITFEHLKANYKEICEKIISLCFENSAESAFLFHIKT